MKWEYLYICVRESSLHMCLRFYHYIWQLYWWCGIFSVFPLYMAAELMVWYMFLPLYREAVLMVSYILCFTIRYDSCANCVVYDFTIRDGSCTDGVVYLVFCHYIWQLYWWCGIFSVLPLDMAAVHHEYSCHI
jgi:uncharacterized integral membrane protein